MNKVRCMYCNKVLPGIVICGCPKSIEMKTKHLWDANKRKYEKKRIGRKRYNISEGYVR